MQTSKHGYSSRIPSIEETLRDRGVSAGSQLQSYRGKVLLVVYKPSPRDRQKRISRAVSVKDQEGLT